MKLKKQMHIKEILLRNQKIFKHIHSHAAWAISNGESQDARMPEGDGMEPYGEELHLREPQDKFNGNKRKWRKMTIDEADGWKPAEFYMQLVLGKKPRL